MIFHTELSILCSNTSSSECISAIYAGVIEYHLALIVDKYQLEGVTISWLPNRPESSSSQDPSNAFLFRSIYLAIAPSGTERLASLFLNFQHVFCCLVPDPLIYQCMCTPSANIQTCQSPAAPYGVSIVLNQ